MNPLLQKTTVVSDTPEKSPDTPPKPSKPSEKSVSEELPQIFFTRPDSFRKNKDYVLVSVATDKLDHEWSKDTPGFYLAPGSTENQIKGRYERFQQWLKDNPNTPIEAPVISFNDFAGDGVSFTNGRHRFAVLRDMGYPRVSVMVPKSQMKMFRSTKFAGFSNASTQINVPDNLTGRIAQLSQMLIRLRPSASSSTPYFRVMCACISRPLPAKSSSGALAGERPFPVTLGKLHVFEPSAASEGTAPIVIQVVGAGLTRLKEKIDAEIGNRADDFDYKPHMTLAYVKPEVAAKYEGMEGIKGVSFMVREVVLSRKNDVQVRVPLEQAMGVTAAGEDVYGNKIEEIVTEMMGVLSPGLPRPVTRIVNRASEPTGGDCLWRYGQDANGQVYADENTTISIQRSALNDENTLRRVIAHELAHHEDLLLNERPKVLKLGVKTYKMTQYRGSGHGTGWRQVAARFNAKYGKDFVTEKLTEGTLVKQVSNVYILINHMKYGYRKQQYGWQYAFKLSRQAMEYLSKIDWASNEYRLVQTNDSDFARGRAKIGQFNGWNLPRSAEVEEKLLKLWTDAPNADISKVSSSPVVYHGTKNQFNEFHTPAMFHVNRQYCEDLLGDAGGRIIAAKLDIENPADLVMMHISPSDPNFGEIAKGLEAQGYDGAQYRNEVWIAFHADQIKILKTAAEEDEEQNFKDYMTIREERKKRYAPFMELADAQRGAPEHAMLRIQHHPLGAGVYSFEVEHVGDLTHRMCQETSIVFGNFGYENVKDKVDKTLRNLERPYGFEREMQGNLKNNYYALKDSTLQGQTYEEALKDFK